MKRSVPKSDQLIARLPDIYPSYKVSAKLKFLEKKIGEIRTKLKREKRKVSVEIEFFPDRILSSFTGHTRFFYSSSCILRSGKFFTQKATWIEEKKDKVIKKEFQKGDWLSGFLNFLLKLGKRKKIKVLNVDFEVETETLDRKLKKIQITPIDVPITSKITFELDDNRIKKVEVDFKVASVRIEAV